MNDADDDFDVSQLRWWKCIVTDTNGKIQTYIVEINTNNIYADFIKIRKKLKKKKLQFIEAKPITIEEKIASERILQFKAYRKKQLQGLTGRTYSLFYHLSAVLFVVLLILLILLLVYLH